MTKKGKPPGLPPQLSMPERGKGERPQSLPPVSLPPLPMPGQGKTGVQAPPSFGTPPPANPEPPEAPAAKTRAINFEAPPPSAAPPKKKLSFDSAPAATPPAPNPQPPTAKKQVSFDTPAKPPVSDAAKPRAISFDTPAADPPKPAQNFDAPAKEANPQVSFEPKAEKPKVSFDATPPAKPAVSFESTPKPEPEKPAVTFESEAKAEPSKRQVSFEPGAPAETPEADPDAPEPLQTRALKPEPVEVAEPDPTPAVEDPPEAAQSDETDGDEWDLPDPPDEAEASDEATADESDLTLNALFSDAAPEAEAEAPPPEIEPDDWMTDAEDDGEDDGADAAADQTPPPNPKASEPTDDAGDEWDLPEPTADAEPDEVVEGPAPVMPTLDWGGATTALAEVGATISKTERPEPIEPEPTADLEDAEPEAPLTGDEHRVGQEPLPEVFEAKPFVDKPIHIPMPSRAEAVPPARTSSEELVSVDDIGFLAELRRLERQGRSMPRIGRNQRLSQEVAEIGQDPFLHFPAADLSASPEGRDKPQIRSRFMGFFGPYGALPLNTTEEVLRWVHSGDRAYVRFTDVFATRFIQLFFRAFSDARPIAQFDRPDDDRFQGYLRALGGIGTDNFRGRDSVVDTVKLPLMPLFMHRVKSGVRLKQMLVYHLGTDVEVEELVPSWLDFEPDALSRLGAQGSTLGQDMLLGSRARTVSEKICVHLRARDLETYKQFLPMGSRHTELQDLVFWYTGQRFEVDVSLWLPAGEVEPAKLGETVALGWMAALAPPEPDAPYEMIKATTFRLEPMRENVAEMAA